MTRVLVQGVGGVGGVIAGELLRAAGDVTLITGNESIASAIRQRGLEVRAPGYCSTVRADRVSPRYLS